MYYLESDGSMIGVQLLLHHRHAIIRTTVIDQNALYSVLTGLAHHALQTSRDVWGHVIDWDDDGDLHTNSRLFWPGEGHATSAKLPAKDTIEEILQLE